MVGREAPVLWPVWSGRRLATTDRTATGFIRRSYGLSGKIARAMTRGAPGSFGAQLKALREAAGFTQEELATIAGLSVHAVSALERGERRRPHVDTVRALSAALDLTGPTRDALLASARAPAQDAAVDELSGVSLPLPLTVLLGRDADVQTLRPLARGSRRTPHHAHRARRSREDPPGAGARARDRGQRAQPVWCS